MNTATAALHWMEAKATQPDARVLFRGQTRVYPTVLPSIARLEPDLLGPMYTIARRFVTSADSIARYQIPRKVDRLAILQHYILCSPVIDLTGTPLVALRFATLGASPGDECVVYSIDRQQSASACGVEFADHAFLILPLADGGMKHRWLRQDGYSVGPIEWTNMQIVREFDFLVLPGVESQRFILQEKDEALFAALGDLESVADDPLAVAVRALIEEIAKTCGQYTQEVARFLERTKSRSRESVRLQEIDELKRRAERCRPTHGLLKNLDDLREAAIEVASWNSAHDCALEQLVKRINELCASRGLH